MKTATLLALLLAGILPQTSVAQEAASGTAPSGDADHLITTLLMDAPGDTATVMLWPDGAPGALDGQAPFPSSIKPYLPPPEKANGAAVVVCPGGGYSMLAMDHEGQQVAEWLNSFGVAAFVLRYRHGDHARHPAPLQDAQRAIRLVRAKAGEWGVDGERVGILGFSAGGHLASSAGTLFDEGLEGAADVADRHSSRPDFMVLVYPVISMTRPFTHQGSKRNLLGEAPSRKMERRLSTERQVTKETPPTFLVHTTTDEGVPPENSIAFYEALRDEGVPAEMHIFAEGKHGFGLAPEDPALSMWPELCEAWMRREGFLDRKTAEPGQTSVADSATTSGRTPVSDSASASQPSAASEADSTERVVFFGDSITEAGVKPGGYVRLIADSLHARYPDQDIEAIGAGISGNRVPDLLARVGPDVLDKDPTAVVVYIGINDVWHWELYNRGTPKEDFESGLRTLADTLQSAGADVVLCTPSVIGERADGSNPQDAMLEAYAQISRRVAEEKNLAVCDLRAQFVEHLKQHNPEGRSEGVLTTDGVHLNERGNRFVAEAILEALVDHVLDPERQ